MALDQTNRLRRKVRIRAKIAGTAEKPRFTVYRSNQAVYAHLIDDVQGKTVASASSLKEKSASMASDQKVGATIAELAKKAKITTCVFDRNGYKFHGIIKSLADSAREAGLQF
jgi:large subunit ribosomal protein L18